MESRAILGMALTGLPDIDLDFSRLELLARSLLKDGTAPVLEDEAEVAIGRSYWHRVVPANGLALGLWVAGDLSGRDGRHRAIC